MAEDPADRPGGKVDVFDGHNDVLLRLWQRGGDVVGTFRASETGHIDLEKAAAGGLMGGFFAMFAIGDMGAMDFALFDASPYDLPVPEPMDPGDAAKMTFAQAGIACRLEEAGVLRLCRRPGDIVQARADGVLAGVLHLEGADCIGPDLWELDALYALGLRSLGPVWSRPTIFGEGVPFRHPSTGDTGGGLTEVGRALVRRCRALGMVVDTSHMTEAGFWNVGEEGVPLVATHSNAHGVNPSARNLTDAQLKAIGETGGVVGLNYGCMFLNPDGSRRAEGALDHAIPHLDRMIEMAGEDHVALGSDFDGAPMPEGLHSAADLQALIGRMRAAGYGEALIEKIAHRNWIGFLDRTLGPALDAPA